MPRSRRADSAELFLLQAVPKSGLLREREVVVRAGHGPKRGRAVLIQLDEILIDHALEQLTLLHREKQIRPLTLGGWRYVEVIEGPELREVCRVLDLIEGEGVAAALPLGHD